MLIMNLDSKESKLVASLHGSKKIEKAKRIDFYRTITHGFLRLSVF